MRSGSGKLARAWTGKMGAGASQMAQRPEESHEWRLAAGGSPPLRKLTERGAMCLLKVVRLVQSGGLTDEPDQGILVGHKVTLQDGHMARGQSVYGHAFESQSFQDTVATLGAVTAAKAFLPGRGAVGNLSSQPDRAIDMGATDRGGIAVYALGLQVVARRHGSVWIMLAAFGTTPFGPSSLIVVAIRVQDVAKRTEWMSMLIIAACQADVRVIVRLVGTDIDHAQRARMPDGVEAGLFASSGIGQDFTDLEPGKSLLEIGQSVREEGRIVTDGRAQSGRKDPIGGQLVVQELTGVAVVAIDHSADKGMLLLSLDGSVGTGLGSFVVASVDNEARFGVPGRCVTTKVNTRFLVALTSSLPLLLCRTTTGGWFVTACTHA